MAYSVAIRPKALELIKEQATKHQRQIWKKLDSLKHEPRPPNAKKLDGGDGLWRVRTGDFRIVYTVDDEELLVVIVTLGSRKDIYDRLRRAGLID